MFGGGNPRYRPLRAGPPPSLRSQVPIAVADEDAGEIATPTRKFGLLEIMSGLPDDSRE